MPAWLTAKEHAVKRLVLKQPIRITGRSFLGYPAWVTLTPAPKYGWHWKVGGELVPIEPGTIMRRTGRLILWHNEHTLHIVEHLLAPRCVGVDSVIIEASSNGLPYDGCAKNVWGAIAPHLEESGDLRLHALPDAVISIGKGSIATTPSEDRTKLTIKVAIDYGGSFHGTRTFVVSRGTFEEIVDAPTLGWPRWRKPFSALASRLGWPHHHSILWPSARPSPTEIDTVLRHRLLDLLGGLACALPKGGMFTGAIISICAGHGHDVLFADMVDSRWGKD